MKISYSVLWQKPLHRQKIQKATWKHKNATKNFDYTTIAYRLRTVSWDNDSHTTGMVIPVYKITNKKQIRTIPLAYGSRRPCGRCVAHFVSGHQRSKPSYVRYSPACSSCAANTCRAIKIYRDPTNGRAKMKAVNERTCCSCYVFV